MSNLTIRSIIITFCIVEALKAKLGKAKDALRDMLKDDGQAFKEARKTLEEM